MPYIIEEEHQDPWGPCPHGREPLSEFVEDMKTSANKEVFLSDNQRRFDAAIAITPRGVRNAVCEYINRHYLPGGYDPHTMRMDDDTLAWYRLMGWIQRGSRSFRIRRRSQTADPHPGKIANLYLQRESVAGRHVPQADSVGVFKHRAMEGSIRRRLIYGMQV